MPVAGIERIVFSLEVERGIADAAGEWKHQRNTAARGPAVALGEIGRAPQHLERLASGRGQEAMAIESAARENTSRAPLASEIVIASRFMKSLARIPWSTAIAGRLGPLDRKFCSTQDPARWSPRTGCQQGGRAGAPIRELLHSSPRADHD